MDNTDPMDTSHARVAGARCTATAKTTGNRCRLTAITGGRVCRMHGGAAPQVRRAAALRMADLVAPAIATLARTMVDTNATDRDKLRAAENVLDRAGYPRRTETDQVDPAALADRIIDLRDRMADQ